MTVKQFAAAIPPFIDIEFLPKCSMMEKMTLIGAPLLGFDLEKVIGDFLSSDFLSKGTRIWTDEEKTQLNIPMLKEFIGKLLESCEGNRFVYEGYKVSLGGAEKSLFEGFIIDQSVANTLFECLEGANK